ncbi:MAG: Fur family transcriptional regulator [Phycisphaerales bacterium JB065]
MSYPISPEEKARRLFADNDLRCTRQRARVYCALESCRSHPTAEELHALVNSGEDSCTLSLATVYNTLEALCSAGLCQKIVPPTGCAAAARYDADLEEHLHVITPDGRLLDVPEPIGRQILDRIPAEDVARLEQEMGVKISRIAFQVFAEADSSTADGSC